jgi:hypothetical protein
MYLFICKINTLFLTSNWYDVPTTVLYVDLFVILHYFICLNCTCIYVLYDHDLFHIL